MVQSVGEPNRIVAERNFRPQINRAVIAAIDRHGGIAERNRAQWRVVARRGHRYVGLRGHVRPASPLRSCGRETLESEVLLPCRSAPPSPSATPSEDRLADWP